MYIASIQQHSVFRRGQGPPPCTPSAPNNTVFERAGTTSMYPVSTQQHSVERAGTTSMYPVSTQQHSAVKNGRTDSSLRTVKNGRTDGSLRTVKNGRTDSSLRTVKNGRLTVVLKMEGLKLLKKPVKNGGYQKNKNKKSVIPLMLPR